MARTFTSESDASDYEIYESLDNGLKQALLQNPIALSRVAAAITRVEKDMGGAVDFEVCHFCGASGATAFYQVRGRVVIPCICRECANIGPRVKEQVCNTCGDTKSADGFFADPRRPSGLQGRCGTCQALSDKRRKERLKKEKMKKKKKRVIKKRARPTGTPGPKKHEAAASGPTPDISPTPLSDVLRKLPTEAIRTDPTVRTDRPIIDVLNELPEEQQQEAFTVLREECAFCRGNAYTGITYDPRLTAPLCKEHSAVIVRR